MRRAALYGAFAAFVFLAFSIRPPEPPAIPAPVAGVELVAHAGGGLPQGTYSNAREAFDAAYARGFRLFEADLHWTADRRIVLVHDWDDAYAWWFSPWPRAISLAWRRIAGPPSHRDFMAARMRGGLTQMDLEALLDWMRQHPDARVITDAKADNLAVLRAIAEQAAGRLQAFIPQAYAPDEVAEIRSLGFPDVILTLYRMPGMGGAELEVALDRLDLFALTVPAHRANALMPLARAAGIRGAVHTINDQAAATRLTSVGASLIYTDYLVPAPE